MKQEFFNMQINRLKTRFGPKHFDAEFVRLVALEVKTMSESGFQRTVDVWIGSRSLNKPPLLSEFREARLNEEKVKLNNDIKGSLNWQTKRPPAAQREHLKLIFAQNFDGAETPAEAVEVARRRIREEKKATDPNPEGAA